MNALSNVVLLNVKSVHNSIESFLNEKGDISVNTEKAYRKDIINFFSIMKNKNIEQLVAEDLFFNKEDILNYRTHLKGLKKINKEPKYKNSTINRFIDSVRSLFIELRGNGYSEYINEYAFHFKDLPENDKSSAGELTDHEFYRMEEMALGLENGLMKSILIGLAARTSIRLSALLSLEWDDIKPYGNDMWIVNVYDKGNKEDDKPIMNSFYQKMLQLKVDGQKKIFNISDTAVHNMIKRLCKLMGIEESRKISFHSLKGYGINVVIDNGGNVFDVKEQGNHSTVETSDKYYRRKTKDYSRYAGVVMDSEMDLSILDGLNKEELMKLIRSSNRSVQSALLRLVNE